MIKPASQKIEPHWLLAEILLIGVALAGRAHCALQCFVGRLAIGELNTLVFEPLVQGLYLIVGYGIVSSFEELVDPRSQIRLGAVELGPRGGDVEPGTR